MISINNISSVVIPFRASKPGEIVFEIKDGTHPLVLVRGGLCPVGGNWIGPAAAKDTGPLDTVRRELAEELTLEGKVVSTEELRLLGLADKAEQYTTRQFNSSASPADQKAMADLVEAISSGLTPFGSYLNTTSREAILAADPSSNKEGFTTLSCYWTVALGETDWHNLTRLHESYGNLSNESLAMILSLDEILERNLSGAFCHEQVLKNFFLAMGLTRANEMRIVPNQTSDYVGPPLATYEEYLKRYDVAKKPDGV